MDPKREAARSGRKGLREITEAFEGGVDRNGTCFVGSRPLVVGGGGQEWVDQH